MRILKGSTRIRQAKFIWTVIGMVYLFRRKHEFL